MKNNDAYIILANAKMKEAKKLLAKADTKKKKKKEWKLSKKSINPLPRINWAGKKRYFLTVCIATNQIGEDNVQFSDRCIQYLAESRKYEVYPLYYNFDQSLLIGNAKINGIIRAGKIAKLIAILTVIVPLEFAEKMEKLFGTITVEVLNEKDNHTIDGIKIINKCRIKSISLIDKKECVDKECKVLDILNDRDIEERLRE